MIRNKPSLLAAHGEALVFTKSWAASLLKRLGYNKCKGTKSARKAPANLIQVIAKFMESMREVFSKYCIPLQLIIHWD